MRLTLGFTGISENGTTVVPEPTTLSLLGLGLATFMMRRRQR
jgi:hypothetical protein